MKELTRAHETFVNHKGFCFDLRVFVYVVPWARPGAECCHARLEQLEAALGARSIQGLEEILESTSGFGNRGAFRDSTAAM